MQQKTRRAEDVISRQGQQLFLQDQSALSRGEPSLRRIPFSNSKHLCSCEKKHVSPRNPESSAQKIFPHTPLPLHPLTNRSTTLNHNPPRFLSMQNVNAPCTPEYAHPSASWPCRAVYTRATVDVMILCVDEGKVFLMRDLSSA